MPEGQHTAFDSNVVITPENYSEVLQTTPADISLLVDGEEGDPARFLEGGVFSNTELMQAILAGHIVCYPFLAERVQGASIDFTLGEYYWKTDTIGSADFYEFLDAGEVKRYFKGPYKAATNAQWAQKLHRLPFRGIPEDHPVIMLRPGERILAHTHEFIGIKPPGTTDMKARSTMGRNGIVVCKDAGWGDPGYGGRWTMEVQNDNKESIPLPVGLPVGQLVFFHTGVVAGSYTESGNYYDDKTLREAILNWRPDMMLPKARPDQVASPMHIPGLGELTVATEMQTRRVVRRSFAATPDTSLNVGSLALPHHEELGQSEGIELRPDITYHCLDPTEDV